MSNIVPKIEKKSSISKKTLKNSDLKFIRNFLSLDYDLSPGGQAAATEPSRCSFKEFIHMGERFER